MQSVRREKSPSLCSWLIVLRQATGGQLEVEKGLPAPSQLQREEEILAKWIDWLKAKEWRTLPRLSNRIALHSAN